MQKWSKHFFFLFIYFRCWATKWYVRVLQPECRVGYNTHTGSHVVHIMKHVFLNSQVARPSLTTAKCQKMPRSL